MDTGTKPLQNKNGKVLAIPRPILVRKNILEAVLRTHTDLSNDDINYAVSLVLKLNLSNQELAAFVLQLYKLSMTGKFSLTYNLDLDTHIKTRVSTRIHKLVQVAGKPKAWPELFDNPYLSVDDIERMQKLSNREFYSVLNTIETAKCARDLDKPLIPCSSDSVETINTNGGIYYNYLYSECYNNVCLHESEQKGKIISLNSSKSGNDSYNVAYISDKVSMTEDKSCFDLMELVDRLARNNYTNPETDKPFNDRTLNLLLSRYQTEINMYKRHLEILSLLR